MLAREIAALTRIPVEVEQELALADLQVFPVAATDRALLPVREPPEQGPRQGGPGFRPSDGLARDDKGLAARLQ